MYRITLVMTMQKFTRIQNVWTPIWTLIDADEISCDAWKQKRESVCVCACAGEKDREKII